MKIAVEIPLFIGAVASILLCGGMPAYAQVVDRDHIAQAFDSGSLEDRQDALTQIGGIPRAARGPVILNALLRELDREDANIRNLKASKQKGAEAEGAYLGDLLEMVCQHYDDPQVLPHLAAFVGTGNMVMKVVANFGDPAVPYVADVANSDARTDFDVFSAIVVLTRIIDNSSKRPLTQESRNKIVQVAQSRLSANQSPNIVLYAVDLAAATGDPALAARISQLSTDLTFASSLTQDRDTAIKLQAKAKAAVSRAAVQ